MAVTSLRIWESPVVSGCTSSASSSSSSSSCRSWNNRQFSLSVRHRWRWSKLGHGAASFQAFSSGALRSITTICPGEQQWQRGAQQQQHGTQRSLSRGAGTAAAVQVFCIVTEKIVGGSQYSKSADQSLRRLILLRHAKSSWSDRSIKDHERPLSRRGRQAAANIALKLQECDGWEPQLILCSDSTRTRETLEIMQQQLAEFVEGEVRYFSSFYSVAAMDGQTVQHLQDIICQYTKDDVTTIMCMGHNRGWEEAASLLSGVNVELKTANAALLETRGSSWQEAFEKAGLGGWKLVGIVKPDPISVEGAVQ